MRSSSGTEFATRLNVLFDRWECVNGERLSNSVVAQRLTAAGHRVSTPYLSQLRSGKRDNPSRELVRGLTEVFGMDGDFLVHGLLPTAAGDREIVARLRDDPLRKLAAIAAELPPAEVDYLIRIADMFRAAEGLLSERGTARL